MKSELFAQILAIVAEICEVSTENILSTCKTSDVVEARCILVQECRNYGIPPATIARLIRRKRIVSVYDCMNNYNDWYRQSYSFRMQCEEVGRKLAETYPRTFR
jgi:hypothetical protein